jgi:hypothetical protein
MTRVFQNLTIKSRIKNLVLSPWRDRKLTPELKAEFGLIREPIN